MTEHARAIWEAVESERARHMRWAAREARRTLRGISDGAVTAFSQGASVTGGEDMAVRSVEGQQDAVRDLLRTIYLRVMPAFGNDVFASLGDGTRRARERRDLSGDFWAEVVNSFIEEKAGDLITGILRGHVNAIRAIIADGVAEGEGVEPIARRLRGALPGVDRIRSMRIARTEVLRASAVGSREGAKATGLRLKKEWIATPGSRTRPSHAAADGQVRDLDEAYSIGGHPAMYPLDPGLPASESVNCRCAEGYIPEEDE